MTGGGGQMQALFSALGPQSRKDVVARLNAKDVDFRADGQTILAPGEAILALRLERARRGPYVENVSIAETAVVSPHRVDRPSPDGAFADASTRALTPSRNGPKFVNQWRVRADEGDGR